MKKKTCKNIPFTIGIPAYNEAENIYKLLQAILAQQLGPFKLEKIIILSDASTDDTVKQIHRCTDSRIKLIVGRVRQGQAKRQNQIFTQCSTPIVVLLNADILPAHEKFLYHLLKPFQNHSQIGLTSAKVLPAPLSSSFINQVLSWHHHWKNSLFEAIHHQDNIYLCHGRARAFSRPLYTQLRWPELSGEDGYSYAFNRYLGYKFVFTKESKLYCALPHTLNDHIRQSLRFFTSKNHHLNPTKSESHARLYHIPKTLLIRHIISGSIHHPIYVLSYAGILALTGCYLILKKSALKPHPLWVPSASTKKISGVPTS